MILTFSFAQIDTKALSNGHVDEVASFVEQHLVFNMFPLTCNTNCVILLCVILTFYSAQFDTKALSDGDVICTLCNTNFFFRSV